VTEPALRPDKPSLDFALLGAAGVVLLLSLLDLPGLASRASQLSFRCLPALGGAVGLGVIGYLTRAITLRGLAAGVALGVCIGVFGGAGDFCLLAAFVALGSAVTRVRHHTRERSTGEQVARGAREALANCGVGAACALLSADSPLAALAPVGLAAAFAAACADTAASELGQAFGLRPRLITTFRPCPAGTDGGVTLTGSAAALVASSVMAWLAVLLGVIPSFAFLPVALAGFGATLVESFLGAVFERRGWIGNESSNLLNTLAGAAGAMVLVSRPPGP